MSQETPIISFPVKGVDLEVDAAALGSLLCTCQEAKKTALFTSLDTVTIQGPVASQAVSKPVYEAVLPMSELEGRIIQVSYNFSVSGELTARPTYLWLNRGIESSAFLTLAPNETQLRGYAALAFKVKNVVFTLLHNNYISMPWGLSTIYTPTEKTITTENVTFQLACAPKEDTGSLTYHHFSIRAI